MHSSRAIWRRLLPLIMTVLVTGVASAEPLNIRVGWSTMPGHMIPVLFSKPEILKHYGSELRREPIAFRGSSPQITAMAAREVDLVAYSPATLALTVVNAHLDTKVIADIIQDGVGAIIPRPSWCAPIAASPRSRTCAASASAPTRSVPRPTPRCARC